MTSTVKDGAGGCAGQSTSPGFLNCGGLSLVFLLLFLFYTHMIYHLKHYN